VIKCPTCSAENKDQAKACRKCGVNLQLQPLWRPTWAWHGRTLAIVYAIVIVVFFIVRAWLKPYVRQLPPDITPWMHGKTGFKSAYDPAH
jgi:hypothetical protein